MNKIITFLRYIKDFVVHSEYRFIWIAIRYKAFGITQKKDLLYRSTLGTFITRKGTQDFMFANYAYEWNVKKFVLGHYSNFNLFIDIGANIGTYSFLLAGKGLRCYAFEPVRENFEAFHANIMVNNMADRITAFNYGLGETAKEMDFIYDPVNTGASHIAHNDEHGSHEKVIIRPFDDVYPELEISPEDRILMKMDVEGMEVDVLKGARNFLRLHSNIFLIMESIHSGENLLKKTLLEIGDFEFYQVDNFNFASKKTNK